MRLHPQIPGSISADGKAVAMKPWLLPGLLLAGIAAGNGCVRVKTEPIHITMDVNLRIQRDLDNFFGDLDQAAPRTPAPAANQPEP
jgi:hypothetical protein